MRKKKELATELYLNIRDRSQFFAFEINSLKDFVNKKNVPRSGEHFLSTLEYRTN